MEKNLLKVKKGRATNFIEGCFFLFGGKDNRVDAVPSEKMFEERLKTYWQDLAQGKIAPETALD